MRRASDINVMVRLVHSFCDHFSLSVLENAPKPIVEARTLRLRSERQTLRRLPKSGVIVFGIRTYMTPVSRLVEEGVGERLASAVRGWSEDIDQ